MKWTKWLLLSSLVVNSWSLAGCGNDGDGSPTGSSPNELIGSWRFVKFNLPDALVERMRTAFIARGLDENALHRVIDNFTNIYVNQQPTTTTFNNDNTWTDANGGSGTWSASSSGQLTIDEDEEESVTSTFRVLSSKLVIKASVILFLEGEGAINDEFMTSLGDISGMTLENEYTRVN